METVVRQDWRDAAACRAADPLLFEIIDRDHAHYREVKKNLGEGESLEDAITTKQGENFAKASSLCNDCPVIQECLKTANRRDLHWTVRAGRIPTGYNPSQAGRPTRAVALVRYGKRLTGPEREAVSAELRKRYEAGTGMRELARDFNRPYTTIRKLIEESGATVRPRGGSKPKTGSEF